MSIDKNKNIVGMGSWYFAQSYKDYRDKMPLDEFQKYIYDKCVERIESLNLHHGDKVIITHIGGEKPRRYKGTIHNVANGCIYLKQEKRDMTIDIELIDDIEITKKYTGYIEKVELKRVNKYTGMGVIIPFARKTNE